MSKHRHAILAGLSLSLLFLFSCKHRPPSPPTQYPPATKREAPPPPPEPSPTPPKIQASQAPTAPSGQPVAPAPAEKSIGTGIPATIRIGIATDLREVKIASRGNIKVEILSESGHAVQLADREVTVALRGVGTPSGGEENLHGASSHGATLIYRIQVGSFQDGERALAMRRELKQRLGVPVNIQFNEASNTYRVRVGDCSSRAEAEALGERLEEAGVMTGWIVSEEAPRPEEAHTAAQSPSSTGTGFTVYNAARIPLDDLALPARQQASSRLLRITPGDTETTLSYGNVAFRGAFEVVENPRGRLNVVNVLDFEDYLKGVVPNEMPPSKFDAIEALKAQAVAARTYALQNSGRFLREGYDLCATVECQTYRGMDSERPLSSQAVEATRGIVIKYGGHWIDALYTSTCGGHTEDAKNIFRSLDEPYLRGVICPPESAREVDPRLVAVSGYHMHWKAHMTRAELQSTIQKNLPLDQLTDIEPVRKGVSGRVVELRIIGRKRDFVLRGLEVKSVLGLKDTLFTVTRIRDRNGEIEAFEFTGRGWGHGVGLCQTGAYGLAREGEDFISILKTYYSGVDVVQENTREN